MNDGGYSSKTLFCTLPFLISILCIKQEQKWKNRIRKMPTNISEYISSEAKIGNVKRLDANGKGRQKQTRRKCICLLFFILCFRFLFFGEHFASFVAFLPVLFHCFYCLLFYRNYLEKKNEKKSTDRSCYPKLCELLLPFFPLLSWLLIV